MRRFRKVVRGVKPAGPGKWEKVFWFNNRYPIGYAKNPDLHVIYYTDANTNYGDIQYIGNVLSVIRYENNKRPDIKTISFFSQKLTKNKIKRFKQ